MSTYCCKLGTLHITLYNQKRYQLRHWHDMLGKQQIEVTQSFWQYFWKRPKNCESRFVVKDS